ncbi:MAG: hypothetical protein SGARI_001142 [Bacillariaceae sp.]
MTAFRIQKAKKLAFLVSLLLSNVVKTCAAFSTTPKSSSSSQSTGNTFFDPIASSSSSSTANNKSGKSKRVTSVNKDALAARKFPRTWVPIASTYEIDPDRPSPVQFLGRVNRDSNSLQCSYHGWEFNSKGSCIKIPQATEEVERSALKSSKSCVASYPTHVEKNVIWFWPWKEDVLSIAGQVNKHPEGLMSTANANPSTYSRDLPYGWDSLVENLIDPSHVPFAHHGLQGKREDAIPINMTVPESLGEEGFKFEWQDRTSK